MPALPPFPTDELAALESRVFFRSKAAATARLKETFGVLRDAIAAEAPAGGWRSTAPVDAREGHLTGGEDYEGLPYVILDCPKCFNREEYLTMRTMLWWGHYVVYALILQGDWLPEAVARVEASLSALEAAGVEATLADDPWDWRRGDGYTRPLRDDDETRGWLRERTCLKLMRFLPLTPPRFSPDAIVAAGLDAWRLYAPLMLAED